MKIVITNPALKFELSPEEWLELLKSIYSLVDSRDEWQITLDNHVQTDLKMTRTIIDHSLYRQFEYDHILGINGSYVDDLLLYGTNKR